MAGSTTNFGLTKPIGTEQVLVSVINGNMDTIDGVMQTEASSMAIVANGNTHVAIAKGQFVFVKNHSTLAMGLYTANSAISANATLSSSNLTADSSGGLNALFGSKQGTITRTTYNKQHSDTIQISWFDSNVSVPSGKYIATVVCTNPNVVCGLAEYQGHFCITYHSNESATHTYKITVLTFD